MGEGEYKKMRSPITWQGGKRYLLDRLIALFPSPECYKTYVDVFGGGAGVLLGKPPYKHVEIYNDINDLLVNFWMVILTRRDELEKRCRELPYSRLLAFQYSEKLFQRKVQDNVEMALLFFYVNRTSFAGQMVPHKRGFGYSLEDNPAKTYHSTINLFEQVAERFKFVQIHNTSYEKLIKATAKEKTFLYVDPPYYAKEDCYFMEKDPFTKEDHNILADLLNVIPSQVALTYTPFDGLYDLYPAPKWRVVEVDVRQASKKAHGTSRPNRKEVILMNY